MDNKLLTPTLSKIVQVCKGELAPEGVGNVNAVFKLRDSTKMSIFTRSNILTTQIDHLRQLLLN